MPYLDADPGDLQRSFRLADADLPDAAILVGSLRVGGYAAFLTEIWPRARQVEERIRLVEIDGLRVWFIVVFGAAQAATFAHLAVRLGARAMVQLGAMGGLQLGWEVGDVLVPGEVVGRDGVSRQLSHGRPSTPDRAMAELLMTTVSSAGLAARRGTLVTTTTIALERPRDVARWQRAGYAGVEMEAAATMAVAGHFGVPSAGAFVLMDNLAADHTVFHVSDEDRRRISAAREPMTRAAVSAVSDRAGQG